MTNDRLNAPPSTSTSASSLLVETRFIPRQYEPNYAYPLLVLLHGRGGDEDQLVRAMPALSWRNYVGLGLRGPETVTRRDRPAGYGWGRDFEVEDRTGLRARPRRPEAEVVRRALFEPEHDELGRLEEGIFNGIRTTRSLLHVHSERIFLVGCGEGAAVAYRLGLSFPERFAGIVAINGWLPSGFRPLGRIKACRELPILVVHGAWNMRHPLSGVRKDVSTLRSGGLSVAFQSYPCTHRLNNQMLSDVDTWLMNRCTSQGGI
ncbi:alpha/beta hydrolase [Aquisphaera insulae]|uniref:alpha/beta hydrolase n=1 Tax=Aquisphaera insulae TaxID=2712864 RepID=UPI0013ED4FC1|nr:esterase [Aquisphaera insulae]